jgi:hypothetical protein
LVWIQDKPPTFDPLLQFYVLGQVQGKHGSVESMVHMSGHARGGGGGATDGEGQVELSRLALVGTFGDGVMENRCQRLQVWPV